MPQAILSVALIGLLALATGPALSQASGGGAGGGGGSTGAGSAGTGGSAGAAGGAASNLSTAPGAAPPTGTGPAPGSVAVPSGSVSPTTGDVSSGSAIPRARAGQELGTGQPGEGSARSVGPNVTGGISGRAQGTASPEQVRQQNERDRAINRDLISGGGICEGCEKPARQ
jgi:hypothetical protein